MILIIEGIDKSGKSTVLRDIKESIEDKTITFKLSQKPLDNSLQEREKVKVAYTELFNQAKKLSEEGYTILFDRAYPSELIYSKKRGYDAFEDTFWWNLDKELGSLEKILLIYCSVSSDITKERFKFCNEEFMTEEEINDFKERYERFLNLTQIPFIRIDSMQDRLSNVLTIRNFIISKTDEHPRYQSRLL